nr:hypothetical protein [Tanacetum cinerariifolium]
MCRRQGYMIQNMERKCVTTKQFWKTHKKVNQVLHLGVSQLAKKATEELIETNLKLCIAATIIEERDAFRFKVPDLVSHEFKAQAPKIIKDLFKNYVQSNIIQVHPTTTTLTETTSSADLQQQLYFKMKRRTFMPPKPDLVFNTAPTTVETDHHAFNVQLSPTKPEQDLSHTTRPIAPIIEDWVFDSEDESETTAPQFVSSFVQSSKQVKSPRHTVQPIETSISAATPAPASLKSTSSGKRKQLMNLTYGIEG